MFWILWQLDILCTNAVKLQYTSNDISPFSHLYFQVSEFMQAKQLAAEYFGLNPVNLLCRAVERMCHLTYILLLCSVRIGCNKNAKLTARNSGNGVQVQRKLVKFLFTTDVHNQLLLSVLKQYNNLTPTLLDFVRSVSIGIFNFHCTMVF